MLAQAIDLDPDALVATVARFNGQVRNRKDEDLGRGETAWERLTAPPGQGGNPYLGAIEQPPFYAAPCHRVILGTKGGPRTNARAKPCGPTAALSQGSIARASRRRTRSAPRRWGGHTRPLPHLRLHLRP